MRKHKKFIMSMAIMALGLVLVSTGAFAQAVPGGTLDPTTIPKYVTPLVIPPVMNNDGTGVDNYDIAVRQFQQQILPGGLWDVIGGTAYGFPATMLWSYGPAADPTPAIAPDPTSQFNYPAYTVETLSDVRVNVRWINELVMNPDDCFLADGTLNPVAAVGSCYFRPHILPLDQTLHWANPPAVGCRHGEPNRTDCATNDPTQYTGPVPIVTHVHGAHVDPHSDGYPEAWWLPAASNIPGTYATSGSMFDDATGLNAGNVGYADYSYVQSQPATTLWYHDHSLGMTRSNVYAGPAGFWLVRGGKYDVIKDTLTGLPAVLPGPAPVAGDTVLELNAPGLIEGTIDKRSAIREIPIVIQDRSFDTNGDLFYPDNRAFFEGLDPDQLQIPFVPDSDIAPTWNPEAFFNVMVVNGVSWPNLDVAPAKYRFRLLNGCNSRFLNLSLQVVSSTNQALVGTELPFYQIGAEQGFLREVVRIETGFATPLKGDGMIPVPVPAVDPQQALLMGLAERADSIVDFSGLPDGTVVRMLNTAPDAPFGGFPDIPADPGTTGQVMEFTVSSGLHLPSDALTTSPLNMKPKAEGALKQKKKKSVVRQLSLNEGESEVLCVDLDPAGNIIAVPGTPPDCSGGGVPFGPKEALLGLVDLTNPAMPLGIPLKWTDDTGVSTAVPVTMANGSVRNINVTENPTVGAVEDWDIYNFTADAHPIHLHLVRFEVIGRTAIDPLVPLVGASVQPWENGMKDTVISYPGEITTVRAKFDIAGLYVWHCHIVEHEDNEMMRPYVVSP
ncbi:MAG: multicopper oxidase domain-containing protein [Nitrospiraceae bacterium]|nr:MAG: multicopper oxidase domain-containing protein [Nitrospiraceae bacterium]